jgi:hypothetical protein
MAAPEPDHSHGALEWVDAEGTLLGVAVNRGDRTARAGLRLRDLTLVAFGTGASALQELALVGQTLDAGLGWLAGALARVLGIAVSTLQRPRHDLPSNPIGDGAAFEATDTAAVAELAAWFSSADRVLRVVVASTPGASPVRCWPHHFDIATLIRLDPADAPQETARSIGVGLSPGDGSYPDPYWYVTPWPHPQVGERPALPGGHWHTEGWLGAVLTAAELAAIDSASDGGTCVTAFLSAAIAAGRDLLAVPPPRREP